jgi:hypothetical protein
VINIPATPNRETDPEAKSAATPQTIKTPKTNEIPQTGTKTAICAIARIFAVKSPTKGFSVQARKKTLIAAETIIIKIPTQLQIRLITLIILIIRIDIPNIQKKIWKN